jgi:putative CocE/NonD family hydrolase
MEPGRTYTFTLDLQVTANVFFAGHRIRLDITSSNFPVWDRNLNTGHDPATDTGMRIAEQTLFHDPENPSQLILPVV